MDQGDSFFFLLLLLEPLFSYIYIYIHRRDAINTFGEPSQELYVAGPYIERDPSGFFLSLLLRYFHLHRMIVVVLDDTSFQPDTFPRYYRL